MYLKRFLRTLLPLRKEKYFHRERKYAYCMTGFCSTHISIIIVTVVQVITKVGGRKIFRTL